MIRKRMKKADKPNTTCKPNGKHNGWSDLSVAEFGVLVTDKWNQNLETIFEVGRMLNYAKDELYEHGEWLDLVYEHLPFSEDTAEALMRIAKHPVLTNSEYIRNLPRSWGTLYEMCRLPNGQLKQLLAERRIDTGTTRREVQQLVKEVREEGLHSAEKVRNALSYLCRLQRAWSDPEPLVDEVFPIMTRGINGVTMPDLDELIAWLPEFRAECQRELERMDQEMVLFPRRKRGRKKLLENVTFLKPPRKRKAKAPRPRSVGNGAKRM